MMDQADNYSFTRYLKAKQTVDDRALNLRVWNTLKERLRDFQQPVNILEIGGGIGTMLMRMLDDQFLPICQYTLVDVEAENITTAIEHFRAYANTKGNSFYNGPDGWFVVETPNQRTHLKLICADIFEFTSQHQAEYDLIIAHAVLDLFDLSAALPKILSVLRPAGLCYFTINIDGETIFEPDLESQYEIQLITRYHQSMDERLIAGKISGDSRAGRHLFGHLRKSGIAILASGSSDWVVYASKDGYLADEAYFLEYILETIYRELEGRLELDQDGLEEWTLKRKKQIETKELVLIVHQLEFLGQV